MQIERLKEGDFITIMGEVYEMLYFQTDAGIVKSPIFKIKSFLSIYLHKMKSKSSSPTNVLYIYASKKEVDLLGIEQEEAPKRLGIFKTKGSLFSFKDRIRFNIDEIKEG
jgi:hypothetical protein